MEPTQLYSIPFVREYKRLSRHVSDEQSYYNKDANTVK
uniref:Uncharacterized protein n=1 Tax=Anguilla anguilla TaxID=7936 RepID=A0A0E9PRY2_ANGAN